MAVQLPKPTEAELAILRVLWQSGPSTVRQVQAALHEEKPAGYTTVLKLLQIMHVKGLVVRDDSQRQHVFRATVDEQRTQRHLLGDLLERAFDNSAGKLVMQALSMQPSTPEELAEIRALLDQLEGESR